MQVTYRSLLEAALQQGHRYFTSVANKLQITIQEL